MSVILEISINHTNDWPAYRNTDFPQSSNPDHSFLRCLHQRQEAKTNNIFTEAKKEIAQLKSQMIGEYEKNALTKLLVTSPITIQQFNIYAEQAKFFISKGNGRGTGNLTNAFTALIKEKPTAEQFNFYAEQVKFFLNKGWDTDHLTNAFAALIKEKPSLEQLKLQFNLYVEQAKLFISKGEGAGWGGVEHISRVFEAMIKEKPSPEQFNLYAEQAKFFLSKGYKTDNLTDAFTALIKEKPSPEQFSLYAKQVKLFISKDWWDRYLTEAFTAIIKEKPSLEQLELQFDVCTEQATFFISKGWRIDSVTNPFEKMIKEKPSPEQFSLYAEQVKSFISKGWQTDNLTRAFTAIIKEKPSLEQLKLQFNLYVEQTKLFISKDRTGIMYFTDYFEVMIKEKPSPEQFSLYAEQVKSFISKGWQTDNLTRAFTAIIKEKPSLEQLKLQFNLYVEQAKLLIDKGWDTRYFTEAFTALIKEKPTIEQLNLYAEQAKLFIPKGWGIDDLTKAFTQLMRMHLDLNKLELLLNKTITIYEQIIELNDPKYGDHEERQVDSQTWLNDNVTAIANLELIAEPVHKFLVTSLQDRKNPAHYTEEISVFNDITLQDRTTLQDFYQSKRKELFSDDQRFLLRLARFVKTLSDLENPISLEDLKNNSTSKEKLVNFLGKTLLETFCRSLEIKIPEAKFLESWDLEHLGTLLNTSSRWYEDDKSIFKTLISSAMTGDLASLFNDEVNQEASDPNRITIQNAFKTFKTKMTEHNLNSEVWLNAHNTLSLVNANADSTLDTKKSFDTMLPHFVKYINDLTLDAELRKQWKAINLDRPAKEPLKNFINALIKKNYQDINIPEVIVDMQTLLNSSKEDKRKHQTISFADPLDLGHNLFAGNRANSCTALNSNAQAIFYLSCDPGTKYIHVKNSGGNITGYARIFLALDKSNKPKIFIDSIDGSGHRFKKSIITYIQNLAVNIGLTDNDVIDRNEAAIVQKLGGSPFPNKYFHHAGEQMKMPSLAKKMS